MPTEQVTFAELFKKAGYATAHIGKWHLGYTPPTMPNGQGFDHSFGHMGGCIDNYSHFFYWNGPNRHDLWENGKEIFRDGEYFGDLMVNQCSSFIEDNRSKPFFLYWAINWPHYPLQGTNKWRKQYKDLPHPRDKYATFVSTMDELIGQVEQGVYMKTNCSWSIDDSRNKFQFGCEWGQLIEDGALTSVVKKSNYRGISATFWRNLKMVGDEESFLVMGTPNCGKGEPNQVIRVGHASPACLFDAVTVFGGAA